MDTWIAQLLRWYRRHRRILPWREAPTPYRVWVSEVMLQQTQVATVVPYFDRFMARFPDLAALASADLQAVLKAWEGLGYYRRARNLHRAAGLVMAEHGGVIPGDPAVLGRLPGVGLYTAAAVASIAFGVPVAVVDGNVLRVGSRLWCLDQDSRQAALPREVRRRLDAAVVQSGDPSAFNQALMELGARVCRPRDPSCGECPCQADCLALAAGRVAELPVRSARPAVPHHRIAVGLLEHEGRVLIARRDEEQMLGGLWEFPGGKQEPGETLAETVVREFQEELGLAVQVGARLCTIRHAYSHFRITLSAYRCVPAGAVEALRCGRPVAWVPWDRLGEYPFPKANHKIFAALGLVPPPAAGAVAPPAAGASAPDVPAADVLKGQA